MLNRKLKKVNGQFRRNLTILMIYSIFNMQCIPFLDGSGSPYPFVIRSAQGLDIPSSPSRQGFRPSPEITNTPDEKGERGE
jgi:hypothetical protein